MATLLMRAALVSWLAWAAFVVGSSVVLGDSLAWNLRWAVIVTVWAVVMAWLSRRTLRAHPEGAWRTCVGLVNGTTLALSLLCWAGSSYRVFVEHFSTFG